MDKRKSAIILVGKSIDCLFSLKQILDSDCLISGVVFCDQKNFHSRIRSESKRIKKYGVFLRLSQITLAVVYKFIYGEKDKHFLKKCYKNFNINSVYDELKSRKITYIEVSQYDSKNSLKYIQKLNPDFLVCHTPYWIDKKVRVLSKDKLIIGGHPGFVPSYRGAHSAFWTVYDNCPHKNGYSIFCLDHGVDSGPLIHQKYINYDYKISYKSNDFLLMKHISFALADISKKYSVGKELSVVPQEHLFPSQIRVSPGIGDYINFRKRLKE
tara:strand:- start:1103 stop:1909 length:807 start_codon:yes stop_codon:yes gene_type:complete